MSQGFVNTRLQVQLLSVACSDGSKTYVENDPPNPTPNNSQTDVGIESLSEGVHVGASVGGVRPRPTRLPALAGYRILPPQRKGWVYFLLDASDRVLYVGKTESLRHRLRHHHRNGQYDHVGCVRVPLRRLGRVEAVFIAIFNPPLNRPRHTYDRNDVEYVVRRFFERRSDVPRLAKVIREAPSPLKPFICTDQRREVAK